MISIAQGQKLRTQGYNLITNRKMTKVLRYSKNKLYQGKNEYLFTSLVSVIISAKQQETAWDLHCKINKLTS